MHYRTTFRGVARVALKAESAFSSFTVLSAWAQNIDGDTLPVLAVATPRETKDVDTHTSSIRETQLVVIAKMAGADDLEDTLDDLSVPIETVVTSAFSDPEKQCHLRTTSVEIDGGGERRVGTLTMEFLITFWPAEPLAD